MGPDNLERVWMIYNCTKCTKTCKTTFCAHLSQIWKLTRFTRFIRKVFAAKILLSGKFSLFVTLIEHCTGWLISGSALLCSWHWCNWGDKQRDHAAEWSDIDPNRERLCVFGGIINHCCYSYHCIFNIGMNQLLWYYADLEKKRCLEDVEKNRFW